MKTSTFCLSSPAFCIGNRTCSFVFWSGSCGSKSNNQFAIKQQISRLSMTTHIKRLVCRQKVCLCVPGNTLQFVSIVGEFHHYDFLFCPQQGQREDFLRFVAVDIADLGFCEQKNAKICLFYAIQVTYVALNSCACWVWRKNGSLSAADRWAFGRK